jgi:hypothetical protein
MLTYRSENWTLNRSERMKIETAEMRFLRHELIVHIRNMIIRVRNAIQTYALKERIQNYYSK